MFSLYVIEGRAYTYEPGNSISWHRLLRRTLVQFSLTEHE